MFEKFKSVFGTQETKSEEQKSLEAAIELSEKELHQINFEMTSFIRLSGHDSNPANNEKLGQELNRISEKEKELTEKIKNLKQELEEIETK